MIYCRYANLQKKILERLTTCKGILKILEIPVNVLAEVKEIQRIINSKQTKNAFFSFG